jgi:hypothetical protein
METILDAKIVAINRVFGEIIAPCEIISGLRQQLIEEFPWNKSTIDISRIIFSHLSDADWYWPQLNQWNTIFTEIGAYPRMWQSAMVQQKGCPDNWRQSILAHYFTARQYELPRWYQDGGFSTHLWITDIMPDEPPEVQKIIGDCILAYGDGEDDMEPPPFFPGDRTKGSLHIRGGEAENFGWLLPRRPRNLPDIDKHD